MKPLKTPKYRGFKKISLFFLCDITLENRGK